MAVARSAGQVGPVDGPTQLAGVELTALRGVRLLDGSLADLDLAAGEITAVRAADGMTTTDAGTDSSGWRLIPAAGEPHAHLDKALSAEQIEPGPHAGNDLVTAIEQWRSLVPTLTSEDFADRARRAVRRYVGNGITTIRTHADALLAGDPLRGVDALLGLREELSGTVTLQVCLLAGQDVPDAVIEDAIGRGIDVLGGCPHLADEPAKETSRILDHAERSGLPVDLHTDEQTTTGHLDLADLAEQVIAREMQQRVTASHCVRLGMLDHDRRGPVVDLVAKAGIGIVTLPITNLYLQGRDADGAVPRGLTAIRALLEAGVPVAAGADNLRDPFNPVGRADPFETTSLLVAAGHLRPAEALAAVTTATRTVLGLPDAGTGPGSRADFMLVPDVPLDEVVAGAQIARVVVHGGRVLADTRVSTVLDLDPMPR